MSVKRFARAGVALTIALLSPSARAGGFEIPDNGTEALGRGGAFVAKADDPTAIQYNPRGSRSSGEHACSSTGT